MLRQPVTTYVIAAVAALLSWVDVYAAIVASLYPVKTGILGLRVTTSWEES